MQQVLQTVTCCAAQNRGLPTAASMPPKSRAAVKVEELRKAPASSWLATFIAVQVIALTLAFRLDCFFLGQRAELHTVHHVTL